ncbi:uncharacterized protein V6R79_003286 [Siganus canaliculatus]
MSALARIGVFCARSKRRNGGLMIFTQSTLTTQGYAFSRQAWTHRGTPQLPASSAYASHVTPGDQARPRRREVTVKHAVLKLQHGCSVRGQKKEKAWSWFSGRKINENSSSIETDKAAARSGVQRRVAACSSSADSDLWLASSSRDRGLRLGRTRSDPDLTSCHLHAVGSSPEAFWLRQRDGRTTVSSVGRRCNNKT